MNGSLRERQARARHWLARDSPAEPLLLFYLELLEIQEPIGKRARAAGWTDRVRLRGDGGAAARGLQLAFLPIPEMVAELRAFVREVEPMATEVLAAVAGALDEAGDAGAAELLEAFVARRDLAELAGMLGCDVAALEFFPRAFLQPVAEAAAAVERGSPAIRVEEQPEEASARRECPICGWPPLASVVKDEAEIKGRRSLVCSLCGSWWVFRRATCPACGETDPDKLLYHASEGLAHVRVDECRSCRTYLKSFDLRKDGRAVPLVDDLATVELDLWSGDRGLRKLQRNLLGL